MRLIQDYFKKSAAFFLGLMGSAAKAFAMVKSKIMPTIVKRKALFIVAAAAVALLAGGVVYAAKAWQDINHNQMDLFSQTASPTTAEPQNTVANSTAPVETADSTDSAEPVATATPTPTANPYDELNSQADQTLMHDTLNVLLVGVDWSEERVNNKKDYVGKSFNSDVMLDLAINFKENKVDMISVPRDSYAKIANLNGVYKLNFSLAAGDNGKISDKAFLNVCKSVQYMFDANGQIPVNYYIGVTMPVMKNLTDAIGGVDFNVDVAFTIDDRSYKTGLQHLDGQGVLDYCRVRKGDISAKPGDLNRVNRQKNILMAVFKKLQSSAGILNVPKILTSMAGQVYTNLNFSQLAALAVFGSKLQTDNIAMHTIPGAYEYGIFNKNYVLIDQNKRVQMMKDIFGVSKVAAESQYTASYARLYWAYLQSKVAVSAVSKVVATDAKLAADKQKLTDPVKNAQLANAIAVVQLQISKYKGSDQSSYNTMTSALQSMQTLAKQMFSAAGYKVSWTVPTSMFEPGLKMKE